MALQDDEIITLVSTKGEKGEKIEVPAYYLKAHSSAFRDMFSLQLTTSVGTDKKSINIELDDDELKIFVAYLTNDSSKFPPRMEFATVKRIVAVCDSFGLDHVAMGLLHSGYEIYHANSWDIFCLASNHNQYHLAKTAIAAMGYSYGELWHKRPLQHMTQYMVSCANQAYLVQLLFALGREADSNSDREMTEAHWVRVAGDFKRPPF